MSSPGPFFIGGTGRSGTSQINRVLGEHPLVHSFRWESRFLIDPGGFEDLARILTETYTPYHADDALRRLAWLLRERLPGFADDVFRSWGFEREIGPQRYANAVTRLWNHLIQFEFDELVPPLDHRWGRWTYAPGEQISNRRVVARYFPDRNDLIQILRTFTDEIFGGAAEAAGKVTWCEKTPFNLLSVPFLWELYPESTTIVIMRHPVEVVASHLDQEWAPQTLDGTLSWLEPVYRRWLDARPQLLADSRYVELRMEDLAADWLSARRAFFAKLDLADSETQSEFTPDRVHHDGRQLTSNERELVYKRLEWAIESLDYEPSE
jgi:omega-hydroxy-beta-dihydromenaquinone-9 sulfotransferase